MRQENYTLYGTRKIAHSGPGRSLVMNQRQGVELAGREFLVDGLGTNGRTPFHLQALSLFAAALGHVEPLVRERAAHAVQDLFGNQVANRAFHHAPGGGGGKVNQLLRGE